jgi:hypothetical protein
VVKHALVVAILAFAFMGNATAAAQSTTTADKNDYGDAKNWLCRPGGTANPGGPDACASDMTTTVITADGKLTRETWTADDNAPIDCFYVYPTVSTDKTPYSDMNADPAELNVVRQQFARFGSKCRVYAPLYRQVTITALMRGLSSGTLTPLDRGTGYDDVKNAWNHYLANDNKGRGFVLIGHSQGSYVLTELIRQEIDGKPIQSQLVSAMLIGATVPIEKGKEAGGAFQHIPLCKAAAQIGCLIAFTSFRSTAPPPANTLFGRAAEASQVAACTNPAALAGGSGQLQSYLSTTGRTITGTTAPKPWVNPPQPVETPWVSVPGLLTARCASNDHASGYLEVTVNGNPADPRVDDIIGDLAPNWGLHLVDMNIAMGNLVDIAGQQAKAYLSKRK